MANESASVMFRMGHDDDAPLVDAWGRRADEDVDMSDQAPTPTDNYNDQTVGDLKAELKKRQDAGRQIDTSGITKKSQLVEALRADDRAQEADAADDDEPESNQ